MRNVKQNFPKIYILFSNSHARRPESAEMVALKSSGDDQMRIMMQNYEVHPIAKVPGILPSH
jgi:hypothetical protein